MEVQVYLLRKNSGKIGSTFFGAGETLCKSAVTDKAIYFYVVNGLIG